MGIIKIRRTNTHMRTLVIAALAAASVIAEDEPAAETTEAEEIVPLVQGPVTKLSDGANGNFSSGG